MGVNKVQFGDSGNVVMDITDSTVTTNNLLSGEIAYGADGNRVVGSYTPPSGGHTIQNDSGNDMTQRSDLQFKGVYVEDDSTNTATKVNVIRQMTKAQIESASGEAAKGFMEATDEGGDLPLTTDLIECEGGVSLTTVLRSLNTSIKVLWENPSPTGDFAAQNIIINNYNDYDLLVLAVAPTKSLTWLPKLYLISPYLLDIQYHSIYEPQVLGNGVVAQFSRTITFTKTSGTVLTIGVQDASYVVIETYGSTPTSGPTVNNQQIPLSIYGIKLAT